MAQSLLSGRSLFVGCAVLLSLSATAGAQTSEPVKRFENSVVSFNPLAAPAPAAVEPLDPKTQKSKLQLHFGLAASNSEDLQARVSKGEIIDAKELSTKYAGNPESSAKLVKWLKGQGYTSIATTPDNTSVYATGSVTLIEKSLSVTMKKVTVNGDTQPSATSVPALPKEVGEAVTAIDGLQPWIKAVKHAVPSTKDKGPIPRPAAAGKPATYKAADILKAYNGSGMLASDKSSITGRGQTIAILIDTLPKTSDVDLFLKRNGLPKAGTRLKFVDVQGKGAALPPREGEETLDVEWAAGIAPGAAIRVYAAGTLRFTDLDKALDRILADVQKADGPRHLSISLGLREDLVSVGERQLEAAIFLRLAALGVTTFVSSGDAGSNPDASGHSRGPDSMVEYQASDPWVIAVGGTSLKLDAKDSSVIDESAWFDSGGGVSVALSRPEWQTPYEGAASTQRLVPDVSSVGDPNPGAFVILNNKEWPVGGTSWSAPMWAGFSALIAEAREREGRQKLGFLAPAFYKVSDKGGFRDIVKGSNGAFQAGPGWDPVTGLGVPDLRKLIQTLP